MAAVAQVCAVLLPLVREVVAGSGDGEEGGAVGTDVLWLRRLGDDRRHVVHDCGGGRSVVGRIGIGRGRGDSGRVGDCGGQRGHDVDRHVGIGAAAYRPHVANDLAGTVGAT